MMGSKVNDMKALYGAMFEDELVGFTHWYAVGVYGVLTSLKQISDVEFMFEHY